MVCCRGDSYLEETNLWRSLRALDLYLCNDLIKGELHDLWNQDVSFLFRLMSLRRTEWQISKHRKYFFSSLSTTAVAQALSKQNIPPSYGNWESFLPCSSIYLISIRILEMPIYSPKSGPAHLLLSWNVSSFSLNVPFLSCKGSKLS